MRIPFTKMQNCGNDFVVIDRTVSRAGAPLASTVIAELCRPHYGIGADGFLFLESAQDPALKYRMVIFNSDGSQAKMCGNGLACMARWLVESGRQKECEFGIETAGGVMQPKVIMTGSRVSQVILNMGPARFERAEIPMKGAAGAVLSEPLRVLDREFVVSALSMGNPHVIVYGPFEAAFDWKKYGAALEAHAAFPDRTNAHFVTVRSRTDVDAHTWERGAGPTLACGTGSSAIAAASHRLGLTERKITVHHSGGDHVVEFAESGEVFLTATPKRVFEGVLEI